MASDPRPVLHRYCTSCDVEIDEHDVEKCPRCGAKLVEIRAAADDVIGQVIDERFEIRDKLGEGGMGAVYRAWQRSVGREVAIKLMDRKFSRDAMGVKRFLREARLASQLSQPNTVSIFDFGQAKDGRLFIAMELIRGRTLFEVVTSDGRFGAGRAARVGVQICDALEAAHALKIVHRDLKLENIIVLDHPPGRDLVKVLDFGLAKSLDEESSRATQSGVVVGTPRYMPPEAAMNGTALPAGDLYALGVILGELVTGEPLWTEASFPALVAGKLEPASAVDRVPPPMRGLVAQLIDPEPSRRPNAAVARAKLHEIMDDPGMMVPGASRVSGLAETIEMRTPSPRAIELPPPRVVAPAPAPAAKTGPAPSEPTLDLATPAGAKPLVRFDPPPPPARANVPAVSAAPPQPTRGRGLWLALAAAAVLVVGAIFVFGTRGGTDDAPATRPGASAASGAADRVPATTPPPAPAPAAAAPTPALASTPTPAPAPTPADAKPTTVVVHVKVSPSDVVVIVDGRTYGKGTLDVTLPRGTKPVAFTGKLGSRSGTRKLVPDHDQDVAFTFEPPVPPPHHHGSASGSGTDDSTPF